MHLKYICHTTYTSRGLSPKKSIYNADNEEGGILEQQGTSSVVMMMAKKFQTFIRCSVKLLISSGNKHKAFLEANSSLLQDILVQLISNVEEELSFYEGNLCYLDMRQG